MQPIQEVLVASGNVGALVLILFTMGAFLERTPERWQHVLTGLCLAAACLFYSGIFSALI